jgi:tight adherence protein B
MTSAVDLIPVDIRRPRLAGLLFGGLAGAITAVSIFGIAVPSLVLGAAVGCAVKELHRRAQRSRAVVAVEEEFPEALEALAEAIRAKGSLRLGIAEVARQGPTRIAPAFARASEMLDRGLSLEHALLGLVPIRDLPGAAAMDLALRTHIEAGGNLPAALEVLASSLRQRNSIRRELEALTAQARLSSLVLAVSPIAFAALSYALGLGGRFLLRSVGGMIVLASGLVLEVVGYLWVRRVCAAKW